MYPLSIEGWASELWDHPGRTFSKFLLDGIANIFWIGFNKCQPLQPAVANLKCSQPQVISEYLHRETVLNRRWRCPKDCLPKGVHVSPLREIPKKKNPARWHFNVGILAPLGGSVNDGIKSELPSLSHSSIDHLAALVVSEGRGSLLVKADIKEA